ncbi:MAG: hypothetical protein PHQ27_10765 [Victivallales bacterium]|nr:hypothetical protein [Victivallales bacterium]
MKRNIFHAVETVVAAAVGTVLLSSCVSTPIGKVPAAWKDRKPLAHTYKPFEAPDLYLEVVSSRRTFFAGEKVKMEFRLINRGETTVLLREWMQNQDANLKVWYLLLSPGVDPKTATWSVIETPTAANALRCQLALHPKNAVLLECPLEFIEKIPSPTSPQQYLIRPQLNLTSFPLWGNTTKILVH